MMLKKKLSTLALAGLVTAGATAAVATTGQSSPSAAATGLSAFSALKSATPTDAAAQRFATARSESSWAGAGLASVGAISGTSVKSNGLSIGLVSEGTSVCADLVIGGASVRQACAALPVDPAAPPLWFGHDAQGNYVVTFAPDAVTAVSAQLSDGKTFTEKLASNVAVVRFGTTTPKAITWSHVDGSISSFDVPQNIFAPAKP